MWIVQCKVWSVKCGVYSVKRGEKYDVSSVRSVKSKV